MELDNCVATLTTTDVDEMPMDLSVKKSGSLPESTDHQELEESNPEKPIKPEELESDDDEQPEGDDDGLDLSNRGRPSPAHRFESDAPVLRPSVVVAAHIAPVTVESKNYSKPLSVVMPQIAVTVERRTSEDDDRSATTTPPSRFVPDSPPPYRRPYPLAGGRDPFLAATASTAFPPLLLSDHLFLSDRPYLTDRSFLSGSSARLDRQFQQQQLDLALQQQQLQLQQQQQQLRFQQQLQQHQQQLHATFGGHRSLDFNPAVLSRKLSSPLYAVAPPSPASSVTSESNSFPFGGSYGGSCAHVSSSFGYNNNT